MAPNAFDNVLEMVGDRLFGGVDIPVFQSLDDLSMFRQRIVDASLQGVVDGFEGITLVPQPLQDLDGIIATGEFADLGVELAIQLHKFL